MLPDASADADARRAQSDRWLTRSVLGFGLASFLSDAGHEAATSALPAFLVTLGGPSRLGDLRSPRSLVPRVASRIFGRRVAAGDSMVTPVSFPVVSFR